MKLNNAYPIWEKSLNPITMFKVRKEKDIKAEQKYRAKKKTK